MNFVAFSGNSGVGIDRKWKKWSNPSTKNGRPTNTRVTRTAQNMAWLRVGVNVVVEPRK